MLALVERGTVQVAFQATPHTRSLRTIMTKYADVPMSFADACLVRMSELTDDSAVMTLDSDFLLYRRHNRQRISLLTPERPTSH